MPPSTAQTTSANNDIDNEDPTWDTSTSHLPKYHVDLCEVIDDDPKYTSLIKYTAKKRTV